jgi:hypothetical protein
MLNNTHNDSFIFNLPTDFVPKSLNDKYRIIIDNYHKGFYSVLDFVNANIKDVTFPSLNFTTVKQATYYGKSMNYKGSTAPNDVFSSEINITFKNSDFYTSYFIVAEAMMYHYMDTLTAHLDMFTITTVDNNRSELYKIYFKGLVPKSMSDNKMVYHQPDAEEKTFNISFLYNEIDIEFIPRYEDSTASGEVVEEYYDRLQNNEESGFIGKTKE